MNSALRAVPLLVLVLEMACSCVVNGQSTIRVDPAEAQRWRQDLAYMAAEMPKLHKNLFHTTTRAHFQNMVTELGKRIPSLARHQIIVEMARIAASIGDGHTNIAPTRDPRIGFRTYPVKLYFFKDGLYVRAAMTEQRDLVGARVTRIGSVPVEEAYASVRTLIGQDNEMDARFFAPFLLAMPEVLHALGVVDDMEHASYTLERQGKRFTAVLTPSGPAEMLPPDTDTSWKLKPGWIDAREGASDPAPLWLKDPENKFWFEYLPDSRTVYVQVNQVGNKDEESMEAFSRRLFAYVDSVPINRFIFDLRLNRGGNGAYNRPLLLGIIRSSRIQEKGKLFTVIGRSTWSAAQFLVNDLEKYTNTLFVGEPTGGKVNSYGDSRKIVLPNSGITVRVSTLWWQEDERDTRQWTAPQLAADLTFSDYANNVDPALNVALHYVPLKSLSDMLVETLAQSPPTPASDAYRSWRADPLNAYTDPESELIELGYRFVAEGQIDNAIRVFTLCVEISPRSWNGFDSLGEAYLTSGDTSSAITSYRKSLALNPKNVNAAEVLRKLRAQ